MPCCVAGIFLVCIMLYHIVLYDGQPFISSLRVHVRHVTVRILSGLRPRKSHEDILCHTNSLHVLSCLDKHQRISTTKLLILALCTIRPLIPW